MILIDCYSIPIYILFDYNVPNNFKLDEKKYEKNCLIFLLTSWYKTDKVFKILNSNKEFNIVILANSLEEKIFFENKVSCDVLFCNHNAFLDEKKYTIYNSIKKNYDLVIDSSFHEYKNVNIAKKIQNTIHIGYFNTNKILDGDKVIPNFGILANFKSCEYKRLDKHSINIYYNQSLMGGLFSECEGACFASSQYLLAGLPVISIKSVGGRDIWYNEHNSIICENNEDSVYEAVELAKSKIVSGEFNREKIRDLHLKQMDEHRNTLIEYINKMLLNSEEKIIDINDIKKLLAFF
jgi:hypothetical protein